MRNAKLYSFIIALALIGEGRLAEAAPGDLDSSFAGTGAIRTGFGFGEDFAFAVAVQADGKLLVAGNSGAIDNIGGNFSMVRYNTDDSLDMSFGTLGKVITSVGMGPSEAHGVRVQADGKIVLAGTANTNTDVALVRYHPDGSLDASFGGDGIVITDIGPQDSANGLLIVTDGKILVAGSVGNGLGTAADFLLARYDTNGVLDGSFDMDGIVMRTVTAHTFGGPITVQPDGKILVAASANSHLAVFRYLTNGLPDSSFDQDGLAIAPIGSSSGAGGIALQLGNNTPLQPDKIVLAGSASTNGASGFNSYFALARFNMADGSLDTSFDGDGKLITDVGTYFEGASAVLVQRSGQNATRIIAAGHSSDAQLRQHFTVIRYLLSGVPDTSFGGASW
jgi:uncharacterized delta-60 repeat protein